MIRGMVEKLQARMDADGSDVEGWLRLAQSRMVLGETDRARATFEKALELHPDEPALLKGYAGAAGRARVRADTGLPEVGDQANELLTKAASLQPDDPEIWWFLGIRALQDGHKDEARSAWEKVLARLDPGAAGISGHQEPPRRPRQLSGGSRWREPLIAGRRLRHDRRAAGPLRPRPGARPDRGCRRQPCRARAVRGRPDRRRPRPAGAAAPAGGDLRPAPPALHGARHARRQLHGRGESRPAQGGVPGQPRAGGGGRRHRAGAASGHGPGRGRPLSWTGCTRSSATPGARWAIVAGRFGVRIAVETLFVESEREYTADPVRLAAEIRAVDHPHVIGTLDVSHSYLMTSFRGSSFTEAVACLRAGDRAFPSARFVRPPAGQPDRLLHRFGAGGVRRRRPASAVRLGRHPVRDAAAGTARAAGHACSRSSCRSATGPSWMPAPRSRARLMERMNARR